MRFLVSKRIICPRSARCPRHERCAAAPQSRAREIDEVRDEILAREPSLHES